MISTSWGAPAAFTKGFNLQHVSDGLYGRHLHVYSWPEGELKQTLDRDNAGLLPLEAIEADNVMGSSRVDEFAEPVLQFGHRIQRGINITPNRVFTSVEKRARERREPSDLGRRRRRRRDFESQTNPLHNSFFHKSFSSTVIQVDMSASLSISSKFIRDRERGRREKRRGGGREGLREIISPGSPTRSCWLPSSRCGVFCRDS